MTYEVVNKRKGEVLTIEEYVKNHLKPERPLHGNGAIEQLNFDVDDLHRKIDKLAAMFARLLEEGLAGGLEKSTCRKVVEGYIDSQCSDYRIKDLGGIRE